MASATPLICTAEVAFRNSRAIASTRLWCLPTLLAEAILGIIRDPTLAIRVTCALAASLQIIPLSSSFARFVRFSRRIRLRMTARLMFKRTAQAIALVLAFPWALICGFGRISIMYTIVARLFSLEPGIIGDLLRYVLPCHTA